MKALLLALPLVVFAGGAVAQEKPKPKHEVAADFGKRGCCPDLHCALLDVPIVYDSANGEPVSPDAPATRIECGKCGFQYLPSDDSHGVQRWFKSSSNPDAFKYGITKWAYSLPKIQAQRGSLEYSQTVQGWALNSESVTYETSFPVGEIVPSIKNWLRREGLHPEKTHPSENEQEGLAYAFSDRGVSVQVFDLLKLGARVKLTIEPHLWHPRASDFSRCPQGHGALADVPIVYKLRRPYYYEQLEEFHGEDRELVEKDSRGEIVIGGDGDHAGEPSTRVVCKECLFEFIPSNSRANLPGAWHKRDKDLKAFKHPFSDLLTDFPKLEVARNSLRYTQVIDVEGDKLTFERATYETTLPSETIVPAVKDWLRNKGFNPDSGMAGPQFTRWPLVTDPIFYFENRDFVVEIGKAASDRHGLQVIFEQKFEKSSR